MGGLKVIGSRRTCHNFLKKNTYEIEMYGKEEQD